MKFELDELREKQVINVIDGKILGNIEDFEVDDIDGRIISIIIPEGGRGFFNFFGKSEEYVIPWECIKKIGEDTILIEFAEVVEIKRETDRN